MLLKSLSARYSCVLICLTLLCTLPALADTPAAPATRAAGTPHMIVLQNTVPSDIVKLLHWDQAANLPVGVTQILPLAASNALSVTATQAGLAKVEDVVKILDIAPRQVQVKFALAHASDGDLKAANLDLIQYASGIAAAKFLRTLTSQKAVTQEPIITTTNNVSGTFKITPTLPTPGAESVTLEVTPRINSDSSITLVLHSAIAEGASITEISTLRTVRNGETLVIIMPHLPAQVNGQNLVLFVTPNLLSTETQHP